MNKTKLTETEEYIWNYINQNFNTIAKLTISELAELLSVSNASITRTLKKKGFVGYSEFKFNLENNSRESLQILDNQSLKEDTRHSIVKNYQEVIRTLNMIDVEVMEKVIQLIDSCKRIIIFARGFSEMIGSEMLVKFQLAGKICEMHTDPNIIRPISKYLNKNDLVIFISLNGETKALVDAAHNCMDKEIDCFLISASQKSTLARIISFKLFGYKTELSYFPEYEVHSRLPLMIISRIILDTYAASKNNRIDKK